MLPAEVRARRATIDGDVVVATARRLMAAASPKLPGDTGVVARIAAEFVRSAVPCSRIEMHNLVNGMVNLVAKDPGRRILRSGHRNTYPINAVRSLTGGERGNGGVDAALHARRGPAIKSTSTHPPPNDRPGGGARSLAGNEEIMGVCGTWWPIKNIPQAVVLQFGEQGFVWLHVMASGQASHGAHVHIFVSFINRLRRALDAVYESSNLSFAVAKGVAEAIRLAQTIPGKAGKTEVLLGTRKD